MVHLMTMTAKPRMTYLDEDDTTGDGENQQLSGGRSMIDHRGRVPPHPGARSTVHVSWQHGIRNERTPTDFGLPSSVLRQAQNSLPVTTTQLPLYCSDREYELSANDRVPMRKKAFSRGTEPWFPAAAHSPLAKLVSSASASASAAAFLSSSLLASVVTHHHRRLRWRGP